MFLDSRPARKQITLENSKKSKVAQRKKAVSVTCTIELQWWIQNGIIGFVECFQFHVLYCAKWSSTSVHFIFL